MYNPERSKLINFFINNFVRIKHKSRKILAKILPEGIKLRLRPILLKNELNAIRNSEYTIFKPGKNTCLNKKLIFKKINNPLVSIIMPVYNKWEYTYCCLQSILEFTKDISYEVIIADDMSTDETKKWSKYIENIRVIRNKNNPGFLKNCNNAAKYARGTYILFLNNDTNVQKNWLGYLLELIEKQKKIGMVGSKLIYPNGKLQESGGIVWKDGSAWNYGRFDDPDKPEFNYVKEVDYISGTSIMIRKKLWGKIKGFDKRYAPAYSEDTDLAFEVRKRGYKVCYQPKSVVVHFEGVSHGTDENSGIKQYQAKNRPKFIQKWKKTLERDHFKNGENVFWARDKSKNKKTIVVIDHYIPAPDKDSGSKSIYRFIKLFIENGLNVKFIGDNFFAYEPYLSMLEQSGVEVLYGKWYVNNWKTWIKDNSKYIDYFFICRPHVATKYIDFIKKNTKAKIFYYGVDLHYLRELRRYNLEQNQKILRSFNYWKGVENNLFKKVDVIYYPSKIEVREIKQNNPELNIKLLPCVIHDTYSEKKVYRFDKRKDIFFVGGFAHTPNVDAIIWFSEKVYPKILKKIPNMKFYIIGSNPPGILKKLESENIIITGYVTEDALEEYYKKFRLCVTPIRYGAGLKFKILEAMYHKVPVVTTSMGAEGINSRALTVADKEEDFAKAVIGLYNNPRKLHKISNASLRYIKKNFSEKTIWKTLSKDITN